MSTELSQNTTSDTEAANLRLMELGMKTMQYLSTEDPELRRYLEREYASYGMQFNSGSREELDRTYEQIDAMYRRKATNDKYNVEYNAPTSYGNSSTSATNSRYLGAGGNQSESYVQNNSGYALPTNPPRTGGVMRKSYKKNEDSTVKDMLNGKINRMSNRNIDMENASPKDRLRQAAEDAAEAMDVVGTKTAEEVRFAINQGKTMMVNNVVNEWMTLAIVKNPGKPINPDRQNILRFTNAQVIGSTRIYNVNNLSNPLSLMIDTTRGSSALSQFEGFNIRPKMLQYSLSLRKTVLTDTSAVLCRVVIGQWKLAGTPTRAQLYAGVNVLETPLIQIQPLLNIIAEYEIKLDEFNKSVPIVDFKDSKCFNPITLNNSSGSTSGYSPVSGDVWILAYSDVTPTTGNQVALYGSLKLSYNVDSPV